MTPSRSEATRRARPVRAIAAWAFAAAALPATAHAEIVVNEDQFRDWIGRCETDTDTGEVVCFIYTGLVAEVNGEQMAARIVVGVGGDLQPIVYLDVPDIAEPAAGFMLQVDSQEPFSGRFLTCTTGWCHTEAAGEVAQVLVQQFRAGSRATASFIIEEQEARVDLPLSLLGFTAAYTQLLAIHEEAAQLSAEEAAAAAEAEAEAAAQAEESEAPDEEATSSEDADPAEAEEGEAPAEEAQPAEEPADADTDEPADAGAGDEPADPGTEGDDASDAGVDEEPADAAEDEEPVEPADDAAEPAEPEAENDAAGPAADQAED